MSKYINYLTSGSKVLSDKITDYISYYFANEESIHSDEDKGDDIILSDYNELITVELYQDESSNSRLYPPSSYIDEYSTFFGDPTFIVDNIYLGSAFNASSYDLLKGLNITTIINATAEISNYYPDNFNYLRFKLYDNNKNSIKKYLDNAYKNIKRFQEHVEGNILIHCFMGASRSASIVIYYLMKEKNMTFDMAVDYLRQKRIIVNPTFRLTKDLTSSISLSHIPIKQDIPNKVDKSDIEDVQDTISTLDIITINKE
jgi:protein tyrosine/serine phosphatase